MSHAMSMGGASLARPEVTRKFAVGLFCGGAFHDVAFTRVDGCDVVGLYDWELRMRKVARSFFPEEGVVRDMPSVRKMLACWKPALVRRCLPAAGCISMRGFLAKMAARRQTDDRIQRACASTSPRSSLWYSGCVRSKYSSGTKVGLWQCFFVTSARNGWKWRRWVEI